METPATHTNIIYKSKDGEWFDQTIRQNFHKILPPLKYLLTRCDLMGQLWMALIDADKRHIIFFTNSHSHRPIKHQLHPPHPYTWDSRLGNSNHADIIFDVGCVCVCVCGVSRGVSWLWPPPTHPYFTHAHTYSHTHKHKHTQLNDLTNTSYSQHFGWTHKGQCGVNRVSEYEHTTNRLKTKIMPLTFVMRQKHKRSTKLEWNYRSCFITLLV